MALLKRKAGGGRKAAILTNPLNNYMYDEFADQRVEDTVIGCIKSFHAELPMDEQDQEVVLYQRVLYIYESMEEFSTKLVQVAVGCSERQARRYMQVLKFCNLMLSRYNSDDALRYIDVTYTPERDLRKPHKLPNTFSFASGVTSGVGPTDHDFDTYFEQSDI